MEILKLTLLAKELSSLRVFYGEILKLPVTSDAGGREINIQASSSWLTFQQAAGGFNGIYHFAFNIPPDQFDQAKEWLERRLPLHKKPDGEVVYHFESWNAHAVYFHDPAGNILELIARHDLPLTDIEPFNERGLLCISEIGVVSEDVKATVQAVQSSLGASIYQGEVNDTFTPVGDEHGLLIVVKRGRLWFADSSGVGAGLYPLAVELGVSEGKQFKLSGPPYQIVSLKD